MASEQDLILHQQQRIAQLEAQQQAAVLGGALSGAIGSAGVALRPGAQQQIEALLRPELSVLHHNNAAHVVGPGLKPVDAFVREKLTSPEFSHFIASQGAAQAQQPAAPADPRAFIAGVSAQARNASQPSLSPDPTMNFGQAFAAHAAASRAVAADPRTDLSKPMGLRAAK